MKTNKLGRRIPETSEEFWNLYNNFEIVWVRMYDKYMMITEVASYDVVNYLFKGYTLENYKDKYREACQQELYERMHQQELLDEIPF